ncbi:MAG: LytTR family DNA-binding domain-containing protein [Myxococcota bacterium]|nr:LytTR family DNA-binding domain-containing protein [Myxococcota bacterium]
MTSLRAIVVDDEAHARADLVRLLVGLGVTIVAEASDGPSAIRAIERERPDVVFLDIELPGLDGLAVAARGDLPPIVFVTAYPAHASEAFDLDACDYVVKPATAERLSRAIERATRRVALEGGGSTRLRVTDSKGTRFVDARRVDVFSALEKYVAFTVDGEELLLRASLDELEARLGPEGFVRAHRAHLVRRGAVERTEERDHGLVLVLASGACIAVSKRLRAGVLRSL